MRKNPTYLAYAIYGKVRRFGVEHTSQAEPLLAGADGKDNRCKKIVQCGCATGEVQNLAVLWAGSRTTGAKVRVGDLWLRSRQGRGCGVLL